MRASTAASIRRRAGVLLGLMCSFVASSCGYNPPPERARLTGGHLARAAERAGFRVEQIELNSPRAIRPRLGFRAADYNEPRLASLRERYQLSKRIEPAPDEWTAQLMLRQWVHEALPGGTPRTSVDHAAGILEAAERGEPFDCGYYTIVFVEAAVALGWQARRIGVDRRHGPEGLESTHHGIAEIWSTQFAKWVVIDAQSNLHYEKDDIPLSAWEIRAEWLRDGGAKVDHVVGLPPRAMKKKRAIVWWNRPDEDETATYFWLYIETDALTGRTRNPRSIFPQDSHNQNLIWYQNGDAGHGELHQGYVRNRFLPTWSLDDAYWTVGVVEVTVTGASAGALHLALDAYAPNGSGFEVAFDDNAWEPVRDRHRLTWRLKTGANRLRLRTVGHGSVKGPETRVFLRLGLLRP